VCKIEKSTVKTQGVRSERHTLIITALRKKETIRKRQEDYEFLASLGYIERPCFNNKQKNWVVPGHAYNLRRQRSGGSLFKTNSS
jgi:hypothetical protein